MTLGKESAARSWQYAWAIKALRKSPGIANSAARHYVVHVFLVEHEPLCGARSAIPFMGAQPARSATARPMKGNVWP